MIIHYIVQKANFCVYCFQTFRAAEKLNHQKSPFLIYENFESILVPEDNGKQNTDGSCTNKYQNYVACSYGYKSVWVDY